MPKIDSLSISILRKSFSPNLVPEMSSPSSVVIRRRTPGDGAVAFTTLLGVDPSTGSMVLNSKSMLLYKYSIRNGR